MTTFTNKLGQEINPGDEILAVTLATGTLTTRVGTYLGMKNGCVQVSLPPARSHTWIDTRTGEAGEFSKIPQEFRTYGTPKSSKLRISTLQDNLIFKLAH